MSFVEPLRTTASALLPSQLATGAMRRVLQLIGEAYLFSILSCGLLLLLGIADAGLLSIFLTAAPLSDRLTLLLEENRLAVYEVGSRSRRANLRTAAGVLCLFLGIALAYGTVAVALGDGGVLRVFSFAMAAADVGAEHLLQRHFESVGAILANNLRVALVVAALGFIYRTYGGMLALAWNACVWATALTALVLRLESSSTDMRGWLVVASLGHLVLEAGSYVLVALAAIFLSKALASYDRHDQRLGSVARAVARLAGVAVAGLLSAAVCEGWLLPQLLAPTTR